MAGYNGWSMSNNAVDAYNNGEKPLSQWTKSEILDAVYEYKQYVDCDFSFELFSKLTAKELKVYALNRSSWHHTSLMYNRTDFYALDEDFLAELTDDRINNIIQSREPRKAREQKTVTAPKYITAFVSYSNWEGTRKHPKKVDYTEIVRFLSTDKLVKVTNGFTSKRISSLYIMASVENDTHFVTDDEVMTAYKNKETIKSC